MGNWSVLLWETLSPTSRVKRDLILQCSTSASTIYWDFCFSSTFLATKCISPIPTHCWPISNICTWQCQRGHNSSGDLFKLLRSKKRGTHFQAYFSLPEQCKALHFKHNLGPGLHVSYWSLYLAMIRHSDTQHRKSWFLQIFQSWRWNVITGLCVGSQLHHLQQCWMGRKKSQQPIQYLCMMHPVYAGHQDHAGEWHSPALIPSWCLRGETEFLSWAHVSRFALLLTSSQQHLVVHTFFPLLSSFAAGTWCITCLFFP